MPSVRLISAHTPLTTSPYFPFHMTTFEPPVAAIKIPYVPAHLHPATLMWGDLYGAEFVRLEERDEAYFEAFRSWWLEAEGDLVIVEQDILPDVGAVESMLACEWPWCASQYDIPIITDAGRQRETVLFGMGLGCTCFAESLRRKHPEIGELAGEPIDFGPEPDPDPPRHWQVMDSRIAFRLMRRGYLPHEHGMAQHLR